MKKLLAERYYYIREERKRAFCDSVIVVDHEEFSCLEYTRHKGRHKGASGCYPCAGCGGFDMHNNDCAIIECTSDTYAEIEWTNDGRYFILNSSRKLLACGQGEGKE